MGTGAITEYVDVAQLALYAFWILFFILVGYLHREGKREGWPLQMSSGELRTGVGGMPPPKTYRLAHGQGERVKPGPEPAQYEVNATPIYDASGAPLHPNGDPMVDGVGAAAWATRPDKPDLTVDGRAASVTSPLSTIWISSSHNRLFSRHVISHSRQTGSKRRRHPIRKWYLSAMLTLTCCENCIIMAA